jgi:hypothetical protein
MHVGFDIIGDLYLEPNESFNWENKATSLYCLVAGNISSDLRTVLQTLLHLSKFYQCIFYTPGPLEYKNCEDIESRTTQLFKLCNKIPRITILHQHVAIIDGLAILGINGWYNEFVIPENSPHVNIERINDIQYLGSSIEKLQKHLDVKKILIISSSVPKTELYFGENPDVQGVNIMLHHALEYDTESKVKYWVFGTYKKIVDTTIDGINYINNPYFKRNPYWAKRINVEI